MKELRLMGGQIKIYRVGTRWYTIVRAGELCEHASLRDACRGQAVILAAKYGILHDQEATSRLVASALDEAEELLEAGC